MYSLLLEAYVKDPEKKNELFHAITTVPCVERKAKWAMKWIERWACCVQAGLRQPHTALSNLTADATCHALSSWCPLPHKRLCLRPLLHPPAYTHGPC
jgi:hypothetical protein